MPIAGILGGLAKNIVGSAATGGMNLLFDTLGVKHGTEAKMDALAKYGLTPQESVGAGGGLSTGGSAGSGATKLLELRQQKEIAEDEQAIKRRGQDIQAQTAKDVATIQGATNRRVAEISSAPGHRNIDEVKTVLLPHQVNKLLNEVKTSDPDFVKFVRSMSMGAQNLVSTGVYAKWKANGFDLMKPADWKRMPRAVQIKALREILAVSSGVYREFTGLHGIAGDVQDTGRKMVEGAVSAARTIPSRIREFGKSTHRKPADFLGGGAVPMY